MSLCSRVNKSKSTVKPKYEPPMSNKMFIESGHQLIDWAANYMTTLGKRNPTSDVSPGWLWKVLPKEPPMKPEPFKKVFDDLEEVTCKGMAHWQHPQFFSYFPAGNSWSSIMGDMLSNATGSNGQSWLTCPVITELETIVMDWVCKILGLPTFFLSSYSVPGSEGYGTLQCSASEAIFYSMVYARQDAIAKLKKKFPNKVKSELLDMLVAYCNHECHCCVERGALAGCIRLRKLKVDEMGVVRGHVLKAAILEDMEKGRVPFFHCAIIGSTGITCSDDLMEVGPLCKKFDIWLHVDAAYAGSSFMLPEMDHVKQGYEFVWSTNINTNKWMMCNFEASLHWIRFRDKAANCFAVDPKRITEYPNNLGPDLRHYGVSYGRRFRSVKLYFVIRNYGVSGLRRYLRRHINLARLFEMYVRRDSRFEVVGGPFKYGLVAFRLKGYNKLTEDLMDALNASHRIHMVPSHFHDMVVIRFALCYEHASEKDIDRAWRTIDEFASVILRKNQKELACDMAMKYVYLHQEDHDDMRKMFPDAEMDKEEAEADAILGNLSQAKERDKLLKGTDNSARDGTWEFAKADEFQKFDTKLKANPRPAELHYDLPKVVSNTSMLHLTKLEKTFAQSPHAKAKEKISIMTKVLKRNSI